MTYDLYIGERSYSSWSLRGWLLFEKFGLTARLHLVTFAGDTSVADQLARLGTPRTVPTAVMPEGTPVSESLAIAEELASRHPDAGIWPDDPAARAISRTLCAEMAAGFFALRGECPMNLRAAYTGFEVSDAVRADLDRIETLWAAARRATGAAGPWLCGGYSAADAFFAPVAGRIAGYGLPVGPDAAAYVPIDISRDYLLTSAKAVAADYPGLSIIPVIADFGQPFTLPEALGEIDGLGRVLGLFPGSTIGNLMPDAAIGFLDNARRALGRALGDPDPQVQNFALIALGRIGGEVAVRAKAFGMPVTGYDIYWPEAFAAEQGIERADSMDALFERADILSLHTNLTEETRKLVNLQSLSCMKDGVIILNCARGELVDTDAMLHALRVGKVAGYGTDVLDEEPPSPDHPLLTAPNCLVTPHIGSRTYESVVRQATKAVQNLINVMNGQEPLAQVNEVKPS